ncbi:MAG: LamG domain-containing protein [Mycoplasma sp.]|nr:LamG domain-containing protein [Mycoplasma sp.]
MSKILDISTNRQISNRLFTGPLNVCTQVTCTKSNIPFVGNNAVFNWDGYFEFNGVDSIFVSNKNIELDNTVTFEFGLKLNSTTGLNMIVSGDSETAGKWEVYFNGTIFSLWRVSGESFSYTFTEEELTNGLNHFLLVLDGTYAYLFYNGVYKSISLSTGTFDNTGVLQIGGVIRTGTAFFDGDISSIKIYNKVLRGYSSENNFSPQEPFIYYKRYKEDGNKKLFLTSRNTKDAIDTDNRIERIFSEIGNHYFEQLTPVNKPTWTEKGILFASGEFLEQASSDVYNFGTENFYLSKWIDFHNEAVAFEIGSGVIRFGLDSTNAYIETSGGKLYATKSHLPNEGYKHYEMIVISGVLYFGIGGILENSRGESVDYDTNQAAKIGGSFIGYVDDLLLSHVAEVSPVGFSNGQKFTQPQRRKGYDSTFIQFPIP